MQELYKERTGEVRQDVPTAALFGIGRQKLREFTDDDRCKFVLWIGGHRKIKREAFERFLEDKFSL